MSNKLKRIISSVLTVVMLFGLVCNSAVFPAYAADACGYDPAKTMSELDLSGEEALAGKSYSISTADELCVFAKYVNAGKLTEGVTFYLTSDIKLSNVTWTPIGSKAALAFKGVFDGCGYAVLKLTVDSQENDQALFGYVSGSNAEIKNIGVEGTLNGQANAAGIVSNLNGAKIANSWNAVDVTGTYNVGGIAANVNGGTVTNCTNYAYISGTGSVGAIAGTLDGVSTVEYSYYVYYSADKGVGSQSGSSTQSVYRFSTSSTEVLAEKELTVGGKTSDNMLTLLNEWLDTQEKGHNYRSWVFDTSTNTKQRVDGNYPSLEYPNYIAPTESTYTATATMTALYEAKQNGVEGGCYSISNTDELKYFRDYVNQGFKTDGVIFFQNDDILMTNTADSWDPIGNDEKVAFQGTYDGQGYVLTGMAITGSSNGLGLFGYVNNANALIKNVGVFGVIVGGDNCGAIVGELMTGTVANCWFDGELNAKDRVGGIVGKADNAQILNCVDFATVVGDRNTGGIVGACSSSTTIKYCYYPQDMAAGCGQSSGSQTALIPFSKDGSDFTLERSVVVGSASGVKLLNVLNHWVTYLAMDSTYRYWKIDSSATGVARIQGNHPTHLYPGDGSGVKRVDEPHFDVDSETNPYNVKYIETATMTELYDSGADAVAGGHYSINSGAELKKLALYVKGNHATKDVTFYLTKDVDISVKALGNDSDGWLPIGCDYSVLESGSLTYVFNGTFDGCGYTVYGLYIYDERGDNVGLFGRIRNAVIKNLGVIGGIVGEFNCGGIAGKSDSSTITNCWANVSIEAESETGGIVGRMDDTTVENCVSYGATLCAGGETCISGGIAGDVLGKSAIKNCYYLKDTAQGGYNSAPSSAEIDILTFTYGFEQDDYYCMLERATQIDDITTTSLLDALNAWVFLQNNGQYSGWRNSVTLIGEGDHSGHYPRLMTPGQFQDSDPNEEYDGDYTATATVSQLYSTGSDGTEGCCYSINGLDDLEALQKYVAAGRKTKGIIFFMTRDVDMSYKYHVDGNSWKPIGDADNAFQGIYDGQGYTVKYLFIDTSADDQGLFGHATGTSMVIKNLGICGYVRAGTNAGGIVGDFNFGTIANCWSSCQVIGLTNNAGGIVGGANKGSIINCTSYGAITGTGQFGGIIGYGWNTTLRYCYYLYGSCQKGYGEATILGIDSKGVQYFNGTSSACVLHEKVDVEGTATQNALSALKLYVDAHPETNYCYWVIGNTEEYLKMGVALFPVLISASGTMGDKDFKEVQAYFNGTEYYSVIKAINAANDTEGGGDVILATNVVFYVNNDAALDSDVRLVTDKYSAVVKSNIKLQSMQQLDGYFTVKDGGKIYLWDSAKNDYALFMYSQKKADPSCNSKIYGTASLNFRSAPVVGDYPSAYNLSLEDGEFIINSTLESGNPHTIPGGSTLSIQTHATLNVGANARIRTTGGAVVMNEGTVKIGNATLDRNGGTKMKGVFEDDGGTVTLPYIYKEGYTLRGWSDANGTIHVAGSRVKDVQPNSTFKAEWSLGESTTDPYPGDDAFSDDTPVYNIPITVIQSNGGTISPGSMMAAKGENLSYQISADTGYQIKTVLVDGQPVELDENNCYHFISISRAHNIIALFAKTTNEAYYNWTNSFTDISKNDWFYESVRYTASAQLFIGTEATVFSPDDAMTREMIVTVLWRLAGSPVVPDENKISFRDVSTDSYAYEAIRWASMFNIIEGYGDGTFGYGDPILREQLVTILFRFARNYVGVDVSLADSTNILGYSDVLQISQGMAQPFQWAVGAKIIYGTSRTTLEPRGMATRAQVAAVFQRFSTNFMDKIPVFKT